VKIALTNTFILLLALSACGQKTTVVGLPDAGGEITQSSEPPLPEIRYYVLSDA